MTIYKQITERIGKLFKLYRDNSNLSMRAIYKDEKISIATVSDMESGKKLPRVETLITLMKKVEMPLEKVFNENVLPNDYKGALFGISKRLDWKQTIKSDLIENKFCSEEIEEILRYIEYIKAKRFNDNK